MSHDRSQASRPQDAQHLGQTHALKEVVGEALCLARRLILDGLGKECHEAFYGGSLRRHLSHEPGPAGGIVDEAAVEDIWIEGESRVAADPFDDRALGDGGGIGEE